MEGGIGEDRQDILEKNTGRREVGELTQGGAQAYFKTGEFGGAGGMGGGVSGDLGGGIGGGRGGHDEERRGEEKKRGKERRKEEEEEGGRRGKREVENCSK